MHPLPFLPSSHWLSFSLAWTSCFYHRKLLHIVIISPNNVRTHIIHKHSMINKTRRANVCHSSFFFSCWRCYEFGHSLLNTHISHCVVLNVYHWYKIHIVRSKCADVYYWLERNVCSLVAKCLGWCSLV